MDARELVQLLGRDEGNLVERGLGGRDLVRMSMEWRSSSDHPLDPADLVLDAAQPRKQLVLVRGVAVTARFDGGVLLLR